MKAATTEAVAQSLHLSASTTTTPGLARRGLNERLQQNVQQSIIQMLHMQTSTGPRLSLFIRRRPSRVCLEVNVRITRMNDPDATNM